VLTLLVPLGLTLLTLLAALAAVIWSAGWW